MASLILWLLPIALIVGAFGAGVLSESLFLRGSHGNLGLAIPPSVGICIVLVRGGEVHFFMWVCSDAQMFTFKYN